MPTTSHSFDSSEFYAAIPAAIRPLILECRILPSEDANAHRNLLVELWKFYRPRTVMQWLDLKKLRDLIWEGFRLGRIKSEIIRSSRKQALASLLLSMTNESECNFRPTGNMTQSEEQAVSWFIDPRAQKKIKPLLEKFEFSEATIDALAFQQHAGDHETLEKMQNWNEARLFATRRQIEEEREVLELQADAISEVGQTARKRLPLGANSNEEVEEDHQELVEEQEEDSNQAEHVEDDHGDGDGAEATAAGAEQYEAEEEDEPLEAAVDDEDGGDKEVAHAAAAEAEEDEGQEEDEHDDEDQEQDDREEAA